MMTIHSSMADLRRIGLDAIRDELARSGYSSRIPGVFVRDLAPGVREWVSVQTSTSKSPQYVKFWLHLGVIVEVVQRCLSILMESSGWEHSPTISAALQPFLPPGTEHGWFLTEPSAARSLANIIGRALTQYGKPVIDSMNTLERVRAHLERGTAGTSYLRQTSPIIYALTGNPALAQSIVQSEVAKISDQNNPAAEDYRGFASRFFNELKTSGFNRVERDL